MSLRAICTAIACALACAGIATAAESVSHRISVKIDPATRTLAGQDRIELESHNRVTLLLSPHLRVDALAVDGRRIQAQPEIAHGLQRLALPAARRIDVRFSGALVPLERGMSERSALGYGEPASGIEGTFLPASSAWYPQVEGALERYALALDLPASQRGLVPGRLSAENVADGRYRARFKFREPAEGISLMAGPYRISERRLRTKAGTQVRLRTYLHPAIEGLASGYLDAVAGYLDLYEGEIGAYPFTEFSIVSSPTPTGFGMPSLTYLGIEVLRLPFIRATSLGHEVLHNWWGNGVYPDYARGNWSEGLTTFMADYAYREREGPQAAAAARLAWLRDYAAMPAQDDAPLSRFTSRSHGASQIVGYSKSAMLFFMLRDAIGTTAFDAGLRRFWRDFRFRVASWDDLRASFEHESGKRLDAFFGQWLERSGAPTVRIAAAKAAPSDKGWLLEVTLAQSAPHYALSVPLAIRSAAGAISRSVEITQEQTTAQFELPARPIDLALDPELRVFRRLASGEAPPILREVMLAAHPQLLTLSRDADLRAAAQELAARLLERADQARTGDEAAAPKLVVGLHAEVDAWLARAGLAPRPAQLEATHGSAQVWAVRAADGRAIVLVSARDARALVALARPLPHYGALSYLAFDGARAIERGVWPTQPQLWKLD